MRLTPPVAARILSSGTLDNNENLGCYNILNESRVVLYLFIKFFYLSPMNLKDTIQVRPEEFITLCKNHDVKTLYAFGSSVNENFKEDTSDIDLLIELNTEDPIKRGENLLNLWDKFEVFFQRKVDLLTSSSIRNPILRKSIDSSKILVYDVKELKVSI